MMFCCFLYLCGFLFTSEVAGHAALLDPPARNVMWRMGFNSLPFHPQDDYLICSDDGGGCPPCGDNIGAKQPRAHEAGGQYATGIITRTYSVGQVIDVFVNVSISHGGFVEFKLCPQNDVRKPVEQRCLDQYPLQITGQRTSKKKLSSPFGAQEEIKVKLKLPTGVTCDHCVMQMTQTTEQFLPEHVMFRNCADVTIAGGASAGRGFKRGPSNSNIGFQRGHVESRSNLQHREPFPRHF